MRFLADEDFPAASIQILRTTGHDVVSIKEESPGMPDTEILARAMAEDRVLLTLDRDYGELVFGQGLAAPPGIAYFRLPSTPEDPANWLLRALDVGTLQLQNQFIVITGQRIRQRPLPHDE